MWSPLHALHITLVTLYVAALAILTVYGMHRYFQVFLYYRYRRNVPKPAGKFTQLPMVTIQLPIYNEESVVERVIEASCKVDYPGHLLQIQVLDDSTNHSAEVARACCERMRRAGHNVQYVHRTSRTGYKAGAMANGLQTATGEFILIFDADFVPAVDVVRSSIDYFTDPAVACVQGRWGHLNRDQSLLTRCQAIFLDGHFMVEHIARNRSGRFINFNGTAGMWRRAAIDDSGGWQHDTLTEDIDLSYRAQVRGWKLVFLADVVSPGELPPEITAFTQQQQRWTKGLVQAAIKLTPLVMRAPLPWWVKLEGFFHLTGPAVYLPAVLLSLLLFPTFYLPTDLWQSQSIVAAVAAMSLCGLLTCSAGTFYMVSQQALGRSGLRTFFLTPFLMALGIGLSVVSAAGALDALFGKRNQQWVPTPKYGTAGGSADARLWQGRASVFKKKVGWVPCVELLFGLYMAGCVAASLVTGKATGTILFLVIFMVGYFYVGFATLHSRWVWRRVRVPVPASEIVPAAESVAA